MKYDIQMTKSFGLNGVRKHQKVEDPRWLYWADKLGLIVWGEMANAHAFDSLYVHRFTEEWQDVIEQDYNHPSIIVWVPINESWGVDNILTDEEQQEHVKTLYHLTKSLDQTRLVVDNDGWQHTDTTDLFTLHDYTPIGAEMAKRYAPLIQDASAIPRNHRDVLTYGYHYNGSPLLITEFGGIGYQPQSEGSQGGWGYSGIEKTQASFLARLSGLISAIDDNPRLAGYCYTQLTDVEQEQNGLMTYDRKPKVPAVDYAKIFAH